MSNARTRARRLAMQGLYEWQMSGNQPQDILVHLHETQEMQQVDRAYLSELMLQVPLLSMDLDEHFREYLSRAQEEIDPVELAILRLATYEFVNRPDIPYRVVINEAVELAKKFGAEQSHRFINGVLDKIAVQLRSTEVNARIR